MNTIGRKLLQNSMTSEENEIIGNFFVEDKPGVFVKCKEFRLKSYFYPTGGGLRYYLFLLEIKRGN